MSPSSANVSTCPVWVLTRKRPLGATPPVRSDWKSTFDPVTSRRFEPRLNVPPPGAGSPLCTTWIGAFRPFFNAIRDPPPSTAAKASELRRIAGTMMLPRVPTPGLGLPGAATTSSAPRS